MMMDGIKQSALSDTITEIVAKVAMGTEVEEGQWQWDGVSPLDNAAYEASLTDRNDWLMMETGMDKKARNSKRSRFLEEGEPGEGLSELANKLTQKLLLPDDTPCVLVPSFLNLIRKLHAEGRDFSVTFRSFGEDLDFVVDDWNRFCKGVHPLHQGFVLPDKEVNAHDSKGYLWRGGLGPSNGADGTEELVVLVLGTTELVGGTDSDGWGNISAARALQEYESMQPQVSLIRGVTAVRDFFDEASKNGRTVAIRDCYPHWASSGRRTESGKIHFVDLHQRDQHTLFLDDNASDDPSKCIVDSRLKDDPSQAVNPQVARLFTLPVKPFRVIAEDDYFINLVQQAERKISDTGPADFDEDEESPQVPHDLVHLRAYLVAHPAS
eukprot:CAMPEP_0178447492 /NCGR_PEP_ID=MMETSP0689_2-20121128/41432_1 /TAXON_ID=160604 /ORGANISM="Amphidinium massartii, Strain CS-259" /LENGTH=380 /DNA_ID=CAMNT_0020072519 /DNA_START=234 /DNA_END=1377 /DNA_ORIENTATION=-